MRILIVEESQILYDLLSACFYESPCTVISVKPHVAVQSLTNEKNVDLIVVDSTMSGGLNIAIELTALQSTCDLVLCHSAHFASKRILLQGLRQIM